MLMEASPASHALNREHMHLVKAAHDAHSLAELAKVAHDAHALAEGLRAEGRTREAEQLSISLSIYLRLNRVRTRLLTRANG